MQAEQKLDRCSPNQNGQVGPRRLGKLHISGSYFDKQRPAEGPKHHQKGRNQQHQPVRPGKDQGRRDAVLAPEIAQASLTKCRRPPGSSADINMTAGRPG